MNNVVLTGRITRDLELKYTQSGTPVLNFSIACERPFKNAQGEREADFINIVAWRKTAENIALYFKKGEGIGIVGRIQTRNYENSQGERVYVTEVVADSFDFQIQNKDSYGNQGQQQSNYQGQQKRNNQGFNPNNNPFESVTEYSNDITDSDLPF